MEYLHYGCSTFAPLGWLNFDASPTLRFERIPIFGRMYSKNKVRFPSNVLYGDIVKGLPVPLGRFAGIYTSHTLEHLARNDCHLALRNTLSYMRPGGIFRLVVPDIECLAHAYLNGGDADEFVRSTCMGRDTRPRTLKELVLASLGNSAHLWMWDERSMRRALENAGFVDIRRVQFNDCADPKFTEVENADRFEWSVAMEGRRAL